MHCSLLAEIIGGGTGGFDWIGLGAWVYVRLQHFPWIYNRPGL